ncbi:MAG: hypothetical protein ABI134_07695 [Byssovorax sp.]
MNIDQKLVEELEEALGEARKQNIAADADLRKLHRAAKLVVEWCEAKAEKENIKLGE